MLTRDDLDNLADRIEARLNHRCDQINDRLDVLNGRTRTSENAIAVLQDRTSDARKEGGSAGAKWGAWMGAAIGGAIVAAYKLVTGAP